MPIWSGERDVVAVLFWAGPGSAFPCVRTALRHFSECFNSTSATGWSGYRVHMSLDPVNDQPDFS